MSAVRSDWEIAIEDYIRSEYPALRVETNNRRIIPSRRMYFSHLEIDIFLPELCLGIEVNGETYHDRAKYEYDRDRSTEHSDEMYKENYCKRVGIELIHVWSSEAPGSIQRRIHDAIERRLADPTNRAWRRPGWFERLHPVDATVLVLFVIPGVPMTWLLVASGDGGDWLVWTWATIVASWAFYRWISPRV